MQRAVESDITTDYVHNGVDGTVMRRTVATKEIIAIGTNALDDAGLAPTSWGSVGIGKNALTAATSGDNNIAIGTNALQSVVTSGNCVAVGANALSSSTAQQTTRRSAVVRWKTTRPALQTQQSPLRWRITRPAAQIRRSD